MTEVTHTPTPEPFPVLHADAESSIGMMDETNEIVALVGAQFTLDEALLIRDEIMRRVNAHDSLVAACWAAFEQLTAEQLTAPLGVLRSEPSRADAVDQLLHALALAEKVTP